jgi:hypothetical protein
MDGSQKKQVQQVDAEAARKAFVDGQLDMIKRHMPMTYRAIQDKAAEIGRPAFNFVRKGVAGQPNAFFAVEAGRSVGTPFVLFEGADVLADYIRQFGCVFLILWAEEAQQLPKVEVSHGAH